MEGQPTITIRPICESDLRAYREIRLEALQAHPEAYGSDYAEQAADPDSIWMERIGGSVGGTASRIFLAEAAGEVVGLAAVFREKGVKVCHSATLVSVYVRPQWRGRQVTDGLIEQVVSWCASAGVRILRLTVNSSNTRAIRCYERCGFRVYGIQPEVIRIGARYHDLLLMWRRVD